MSLSLATHLSDVSWTEVDEGGIQLEETKQHVCPPDPRDREGKPLLDSKVTTKFSHLGPL